MSKDTGYPESSKTPTSGLRNRTIGLWPAVLGLMVAIWFSPILRLSGGWWDSHTLWADPLRALGVVEAWRCGLWDARWFPGFDFGYGYPFLSYYAPLFHWLSGLWVLILSSPSVAVRANLFCWLVFGTVGIYLAGERVWDFLSNGRAAPFRPGLICAAGWLMSPYLMCQVFVRGALPEFASSQTVPWIVWVAFGILGRPGAWHRRDSRELLLMVLFISAGILTHNFFGMCIVAIAVGLMPIVLLVRAFGHREPGEMKSVVVRSIGWAIGLAWALLATVFYWLPALRESRFVRVGILKEMSYTYFNHYLYLSNLLNVSYWNFGVSLRGPNDEMPLHLGFVSLLATASTLIALLLPAISPKRRDGKLAAGIVTLVLATAIGILLTTSLSGFLWDRFSLLQFAQFPWRLLAVPTVGVCLLLPAAVVAANPARHRLAVAAMLLVVAVCFGASHHFYAGIKAKIPRTEDLDPKNWPNHQILTADLDEYGPIWREKDRRLKWSPGFLIGSEQIEVLSANARLIALEASIRNKSNQPRPIVVAWNYFPGWQARIEPGNKPLPIAPGPSTGLILIEDIPPGHSRLRVWFGDTPLRRWCKIVSGVAWLVWLGSWIVAAATKRFQSFRNRRWTPMNADKCGE
jgi:hypothetical protein